MYAKKAYHFCHLLKNVIRQNLPCQKVSVFEFSYNFATNGSKFMVKQSMTINFFHLLKNGLRQVLPSMPRNFSVWSWVLFFNHRNELYVEEDYQFLPLFKKCIPIKTS